MSGHSRCVLVSVYLHGDDIRPPDDDAAVGIAEAFLADYGGDNAYVTVIDNEPNGFRQVARAEGVKHEEATC